MHYALKLEELRQRINPVAVWAANGNLYTSNIEVTDLFSGFAGAISTAAIEVPGAATGTDGGLGVYKVAAGAGPGGGPRVTVGLTPTTILGQLANRQDFFAFEPTFTGGVTVAVGDVTGDGTPDVVVGTGSGGGPRVEVFDGTDLHLVSSFFAYDADFRDGVNVAVANGDVVTGVGVGGGPNVRIFDAHGTQLSSFFAGDPSLRDGVQVAAGDLSLSGTDQLATLAKSSSGYTLGTFDQYGTQLNSFEVLTGFVGLRPTFGVDYLGNSLIGRPDVAYSDPVTGDTFVDEWDTGGPFVGGRLIDHVDLNFFDPSINAAPVQLGSVSQVNGVTRFDLNGGLLSTYSAEALDGGNPLTGPLDPAPGGAAIGPEISQQAGTLTGYVQDANGTTYGLTNEHVVVPEGTGPAGAIGSNQVQPGPYFDGPYRSLGTVTQYGDLSQSVDAALIKLNDPSDIDTRSAYQKPDGSLGYVQAHGTGTVKVGDLVYAVGVFGTVEGLVIATGATAEVTGEPGVPAGQPTTFSDQIVMAGVDFGVQDIIPGDSGSLVISQDGTRVAMAFAGGSQIGIAMPIQSVLNNLGVSFA